MSKTLLRVATPLAVGMVVAATLSPLARAETPGQGIARSPERARSLLLAERNQLGLLEYCRAAGFASEAVLELQRRTLSGLAPSARGEEGEAEEAAGRNGMIAFGRPQGSFTEDAAAQGISLRYNCEQIVIRVSASTRR